MACGIYALYWEKQDLIYIGQTINTDRRVKEHTDQLKKNKHSNYKLQDAYNKFGLPSFSIIEVCTESSLNKLEIHWTDEFNAIDSDKGLGIIEPGTVSGRGYQHSSSKYTKLQILLAFRYLSKNNKILTYTEIAKLSGVKHSALASLRSGNSHVWLRDRYPNTFNKMLSINRAPINKYLLNPVKVLSPYGEVFTITNISKFAEEHGMDHSPLNRLILGKAKSYKRWKLCLQ